MTVHDAPDSDGVSDLTVGGGSVAVASEALAVIDIVQATSTSDRFGWYAVGRPLFNDLRHLIHVVGEPAGLCCVKSTGDGFLVTFRDTESAELAALGAVRAARMLLEQLSARNEGVPEERCLDVRIALHFGEVDVLAADREGPNVSYAFRIEGITRGSLPQALNPIDPSELPLRNYILCSEQIAGILDRREPDRRLRSCGLFKLKGFAGWWEIFLVVD